MSVRHLAASATVEDVTEVLTEDGCAVIDRVVDREVLDRIDDELAGYVATTPYGSDDFSGPRTRRTGALIARSPTTRDLVAHPLVLGAVGNVLGHATNFQLHLTQVITIDPGAVAQGIHRDQWAFDLFSFPGGFEASCNTIWALTEFTEENGATRLVPGSHRREDGVGFTEADTEPAEMDAGSVLIYTGALYHGGGANRSDVPRAGANITYALGWLRQEENQYLSVPPDLARELPDDLLRLIGYAHGAYALGYVDDLRDPLDWLRGGAAGTSFGVRT